MKREFLQAFKVGDSPLPKEVIDAIMEENGRDINNAKAAAVKPYEDYEAIRQENDRLKADSLADGMTAAQWKEKLAQVEFENVLHAAISSLGGRNAKAITALLELDTLSKSENRQEAICAALENLKLSDGYLFAQDAPPPYARGTGAHTQANQTAPTDLAGALREKFERK